VAVVTAATVTVAVVTTTITGTKIQAFAFCERLSFFEYIDYTYCMNTPSPLLPVSFSEFTSDMCNRGQFIIDYLMAHGIIPSIINLASSRHIFVKFDSACYNPLFKLKTVLAHYDRAPGSPGANDNSAAVFQLLDWVQRLKSDPRAHNVRVIFTDGEELGATDGAAGGGVAGQGAFGIASRYKALGITSDDVYVFDCCGRGDVPVLSKAGLSVSKSALFNMRLNDLHIRAQELLKTVSPQNWMTLPVPYSDNAGFLACGIPAVAITLLPSSEATQYLYDLRRSKALAAAVMHSGNEINECLPATWQLLHTPGDNDASLTPKSFTLMARLLDLLAEKRAIA
jgi:hypothetical protein